MEALKKSKLRRERMRNDVREEKADGKQKDLEEWDGAEEQGVESE